MKLLEQNIKMNIGVHLLKCAKLSKRLVFDLLHLNLQNFFAYLFWFWDDFSAVFHYWRHFNMNLFSSEVQYTSLWYFINWAWELIIFPCVSTKICYFPQHLSSIKIQINQFKLLFFINYMLLTQYCLNCILWQDDMISRGNKNNRCQALSS